MAEDKIRVAICGSANCALVLTTLFRLEAREDLEVDCVMTDGCEETRFDGYLAVDEKTLGDRYRAGDFAIAICATENARLKALSLRLMNLGILNQFYMPQYYYNLPLGELSPDRMDCLETDKPRLDYLEYHIADHCNLNCKGCTHLSNVAEPRFGDLEQFGKDIARLRELFWGITTFRLMGGEPLLNPQLPEFLLTLRSYFPDTEIHVVSNGLLMTEERAELLQTMRQVHANLDISQYPPAVPRHDKIRTLCSIHGVRCYFTDPVHVFRNCMDPSGESDPAVSFANCDVSKCTFLERGRISTCILPFLMDRYGEVLGAEMTAGPQDIIDLYDPNITGIDILERISRPMASCRYCDPLHTNAYPWAVANRHVAKAEDWLAKKE